MPREDKADPTFTVLAITVLLSCAGAAAMAGQWPQWRGPGGLGVSDETGLATEWGPERNLAWKTAIPGRGHSSPIVWGNRIFLTTSVRGEQVPGHTAPDHIGWDGKPGYLHPDSTGVDHRQGLVRSFAHARSFRLQWPSG